MKFVRVPVPTNAEEMRAYLQRKTVEDDITGCMVWQAHAHLGQFPMMRFDERAMSARRVIYQMIRGTIKAGWQVGVQDTCHCLCVTPEHLVQRNKAKAGLGMRSSCPPGSRSRRLNDASLGWTWQRWRPSAQVTRPGMCWQQSTRSASPACRAFAGVTAGGNTPGRGPG
jgi:hypothetical protein